MVGDEKTGDTEPFPRFGRNDRSGEGEGKTGTVFASVRGFRVSYCG